MARLGRSYPVSSSQVKNAARRIFADASLDVVVTFAKDLFADASLDAVASTSNTVPYTVPFVVGTTTETLVGYVLTADASLTVTAGLGNQFPYTFPFTFQTSNVLAKTYGGDTDTAVTATPTGQVNWDAYAQSSGQIFAGLSANATVSTTIAASLSGTALGSPAADRNANVDSVLVAATATADSVVNWDAQGLAADLTVTAGLGNQFPYTFPFTFQTSNVLAKTYGGDADTAVTATPTAQVNWTAYAQSSGEIVAGLSAAATVSTTIAASLSGTVSLEATGGRGQTVDSSLLTTVSYNSAFPYVFPVIFSSVLVDTTRGVFGDTSLTTTVTSANSQVTNDTIRGQFADSLLDGTATATDAVDFSALLDSSQDVTVSRDTTGTRNAIEDTDLAGTASPSGDVVQGRNVYSDTINVTVTNPADASTSLYSDSDTAVTVTTESDSTRNANFFSYDQIITAQPSAEASIVARADAEEITVVVSDSPAADRNAIVDSVLVATATVESAVNWDAQSLTADLAGIADFVAVEAADMVSDIFGGEVAVGITAEATRNVFVESEDVGITVTIPDSESLRNVGVDADLPVEATFIAIRSVLVDIDSDELAVTATAQSDPVKGRIGFVELLVTAELSADTTYGQPLDADHTSTAEATAGFSQQQPLDGDLPVTASLSTTFIRNQFSESDNLSTEAGVDSAVLFGARVDTDLAVTSSRYGEIIRNHNADAPLGITDETTGAVDFDALLDADLPVTASTYIDFLRNARVNSHLDVTAGHFVLIYNDAETEAQFFVTSSSNAEVTRNQFIDADLSVTAEVTSPEPSRGQLLDSDVLGIVTTDTDPLYNQFLDANMPVSNGPGGAVNFDALLNSNLTVTPSSLIDFTKGMSLDGLLALLAPTEERLKSDLFSNSALQAFSGDIPNVNMGRFLYTDQAVTVLTVNMLNFDAVTGALLEIPAAVTSDVSELLSSNFFPFYL